MKKIGKVKLNKKTACYEQKFMTDSGNIATWSYWTCVWNYCDFYSVNKQLVIAHQKTCKHGPQPKI